MVVVYNIRLQGLVVVLLLFMISLKLNQLCEYKNSDLMDMLMFGVSYTIGSWLLLNSNLYLISKDKGVKKLSNNTINLYLHMFFIIFCSVYLHRYYKHLSNRKIFIRVFYTSVLSLAIALGYTGYTIFMFPTFVTHVISTLEECIKNVDNFPSKNKYNKAEIRESMETANNLRYIYYFDFLIFNMVYPYFAIKFLIK